MINTDKPFKGIQPFRLGGGGNHQGTIQAEWSTLINPSRGFNPLGWVGGEHQGTIQGEWSTLRNPSRRFNPLGWVGGEPSGYHTGGMINTEKPLNGIQPFRLGGGGNHQGTIQAEWLTLINPSRGFNPLGWVGGGTIRVPYRGNDQHWENLQGDSTL